MNCNSTGILYLAKANAPCRSPHPCGAVAPVHGGARNGVFRGTASSSNSPVAVMSSIPWATDLSGISVVVGPKSFQDADSPVPYSIHWSIDDRRTCLDQIIGIRVKPTISAATIAASPRGKSSSSTSFRGGLSSSRCQIRTKKV